jgi:hypothetical protein
MALRLMGWRIAAKNCRDGRRFRTGIKDVFMEKTRRDPDDLPSRASWRILLLPYDSTAVARGWNAAERLFLGKLNCDEFCDGSRRMKIPDMVRCTIRGFVASARRVFGRIAAAVAAKHGGRNTWFGYRRLDSTAGWRFAASGD